MSVWFRDEAGNTSAVASDSISLDTVVPTNGSVTATPSSGQVELAWSGYADTLSGVSSYKVMYATGTATPGASCRTGTLAWEGTDSGVVLTGLGDGTTYNYIVCALDAAGNASTGTRITTRPAPPRSSTRRPAARW